MERVFRSLESEWIPTNRYRTATQAFERHGLLLDELLQLATTASVK